MRDAAVTRQDCIKASPFDVQVAVPEILLVIGNDNKLQESCAIDESLMQEGLYKKSNGGDGIEVVIDELIELGRAASVDYNDARFSIISKKDKRMDAVAPKANVANVVPSEHRFAGFTRLWLVESSSNCKTVCAGEYCRFGQDEIQVPQSIKVIE